MINEQWLINTFHNLLIVKKYNYYRYYSYICSEIISKTNFTTGSEIQEALDKLCLEMKDSLSGFLFCGILKCSDGTIKAKASASVELLKTTKETSPFFTTIVT